MQQQKLIVALALTLPIALAAAKPDAGERLEIKRFHRVNKQVYRGAQPSYHGFKALAAMGVKTIVDLRHEASQLIQEQRIVESLGMNFLSVPMNMGAPTDDQITRVLHQLDAIAAGPVFVHCRGGRDRTGTVIACYRIAHDRWESGPALAEARVNGMRSSDVDMERYVKGFHPTP